jgi:hypothetical protein
MPEPRRLLSLERSNNLAAPADNSIRFRPALNYFNPEILSLKYLRFGVMLDALSEEEIAR